MSAAASASNTVLSSKDQEINKIWDQIYEKEFLGYHFDAREREICGNFNLHVSRLLKSVSSTFKLDEDFYLQWLWHLASAETGLKTCGALTASFIFDSLMNSQHLKDLPTLALFVDDQERELDHGFAVMNVRKENGAVLNKSSVATFVDSQYRKQGSLSQLMPHFQSTFPGITIATFRQFDPFAALKSGLTIAQLKEKVLKDLAELRAQFRKQFYELLDNTPIKSLETVFEEYEKLGGRNTNPVLALSITRQLAENLERVEQNPHYISSEFLSSLLFLSQRYYIESSRKNTNVRIETKKEYVGRYLAALIKFRDENFQVSDLFAISEKHLEASGVSKTAFPCALMYLVEHQSSLFTKKETLFQFLKIANEWIENDKIWQTTSARLQALFVSTRELLRTKWLRVLKQHWDSATSEDQKRFSEFFSKEDLLKIKQLKLPADSKTSMDKKGSSEKKSSGDAKDVKDTKEQSKTTTGEPMQQPADEFTVAFGLSKQNKSGTTNSSAVQTVSNENSVATSDDTRPNFDPVAFWSIDL